MNTADRELTGNTRRQSRKARVIAACLPQAVAAV